MDEKRILRQYIKTRLQRLNADTYQSLSRLIATNLFQTSQWNQAKTIGITISAGREVDTKSIIEEAWRQNKRIVVPKAIPKKREMDFHTLVSFSYLEEGYAGIMEPMESETITVKPNDIDLLIVPGLIFDKCGYRIGYGGGFYDRFLTKYKGDTVSLAFHFQQINEVPTDQYDLPVQCLITNEKVWMFDEFC